MFSRRRLYLTDLCFPRPLSPLVRRDINHVEHILKLPLISPLLRTELRAPPLDRDGQQHLRRRRGPRDEFSLGAPFGECGAHVS